MLNEKIENHNFDSTENVFIIPENEIQIDFVRSSGPGGQNVNKVSTKAQLHWKVGESQVFDEAEKHRIREVLANRLTKEDEIVLSCDEERSQTRNKEIVIERLNDLVASALVEEEERVPTRPTRASREKRLGEKKIQAEKKKGRKNIEY